jgi:hypothetical protein
MSRAGGSYANGMYTDPGAPTARFVKNHVNNVVGLSMCTSGATSLAVCGITVTDINLPPQCDASGCTRFLMNTSKPGSSYCWDGDSGGPGYVRQTGTDAGVNGIIIGLNLLPSECKMQQAQSIIYFLNQWPATN